MLDCRKLICPQPVLRTKELLDSDSPDEVEVLVDNPAAGENVSRLLGRRGYRVSVEPKESDLLVKARLADTPNKKQQSNAKTVACPAPVRRMAVFINSDRMGRGDDELGKGLMKNFLLTLPEMGKDLWRIIFVNAGVKLCCQGSESLDDLEKLVESGVSILVCGTCLNHFGLLEQKKVGETTNMLDVVTSLQVASKVIKV